MPELRRALARCLLVAVVCVPVAGARAQAPIPGMEPGFREVFRNRNVIVITDDALTPQRAAQYAERVIQAYRFVAQTQRWRNPGPIEAPVTLKVWVQSLWKERHPNALGVASEGRFFATSGPSLETDLSQGTLAHELTHIQDARELHGKRLPNFLLEGRALRIGRMYRDSLHLEDHAYDAGVARTILHASPEKVLEILTTGGEEAGPDSKLMEFVGVFFVEYLRARFEGAGVRDAVERLGRVVEEFAAGAPLDEAFQHHFKVPLRVATQQFHRMFVATQAHPAERLTGTIYAGLVN